MCKVIEFRAPDVITEDELKYVFRLQRCLDEIVATVQDRLNTGARLEPGSYRFERSRGRVLLVD